MRKTVFTLLVLIMGLTVKAQDYKTGIGLRGGPASGLTFKHFVNESAAIEANITTRWNGVHLTGLYDLQYRTFDVAGLYWVYGFGAHLGFTDGENKRFEDGENHTLFGADLMLGIEYTFENLPVNVGLGWKPYFDFIGDSQFVPDDFAITARFVFGKS